MMDLLKQRKNTHIARPIRLWQFIILVLLPIIFLGIVFFWSPRLKRDIVETKELTPPNTWGKFKNFITMVDEGLRRERDKRLNILILGKGGATHEGPDLTDTIVLASIQSKTGETALISIPRDLYVDLGKWGHKKINNAYAFERAYKGSNGSFTANLIEKIFDLPIHYYIVIDFAGFKDIIDDLGGVRIYVDRAFTDTSFPAFDFKTQTVSFAPGWQIMNGERALQFVRSRHGTNGENTDFARAHRQQKLILALKSAILSRAVLTNPQKLVELAINLKKYVNTNIGTSDLWRISKLATKLNLEGARLTVLDDAPTGLLAATTTADGAYILLPKNQDWDLLAKVAKDIFE